jgi:hypothetical protein
MKIGLSSDKISFKKEQGKKINKARKREQDTERKCLKYNRNITLNGKVTGTCRVTRIDASNLSADPSDV